MMSVVVFKPFAEAGIRDGARQHKVRLDVFIQQLAEGIEERVDSLPVFDPPHEQDLPGGGGGGLVGS
jgi:hypothetical protein